MRENIYDPDSKEIRYNTGADFWRDNIFRYGLNEALVIGGNYLNTQLKQELSSEEKQFCRELFAAMLRASAGKPDPAKLVYPYPFEEADRRFEASYYDDSRRRNSECARAIDAAINGSQYKTYHYNLDIAAMMVVHLYGFQRVNAVLANCFRRSEWDGRYSPANKQWARGFELPEKANVQAHLNAHPILIEDFTRIVRELYTDFDAERYALPGQPESGEVVEGYEIVQAITFDENRGLAIAAHPTAGFVCWQFRVNGGVRDYELGHYTPDEQSAAANYVARALAHMSGEAREEPQRVLPSVPKPSPRRKSGDRGER